MSKVKATWDDYMREIKVAWSDKNHAAACKEGWTVFYDAGKLQIQKLDAPPQGTTELSSDGEAYKICTAKALAGSKMHLLALYLDGKNTHDEIAIPKNML